uniref:Retinaldehyde-binding protein 1 n=1 Tax=Cacopsylla melanoneura TaxID=428564 RepID=A0A8D8Q0M3_9HEMI
MVAFELRFEDEDTFEPFYQETAERELRESEDNIKTGLKKLKDLIKSEDNFYVPLDEDVYLMSFLRSCKYYPESAFARMRSLFKFKARYPQYCANLLPQNERNVFESNMFTVIPTRDQLGRRVLIAEAGEKWNTKEVSLTEIYKCLQMILEAAMVEPRTQIAGCAMIVDMKGLNGNHIWQFSPGFAKLVLDWQQDCLPVRLKAIHIVNQPYIFNMLFQLFRPFLREKLRTRIFFHGSNTEGLLKYFDAKCIPIKFGGHCTASLESGHELWRLMCQYTDQFERKAKYGYTSSDSKQSMKLKDNKLLSNNNNEDIAIPDNTELI